MPLEPTSMEGRVQEGDHAPVRKGAALLPHLILFRCHAEQDRIVCMGVRRLG